MTETPDPGQQPPGQPQQPPQQPPQVPYGGDPGWAQQSPPQPPQAGAYGAQPPGAYGSPPPYGSWAPQDHPRAMTSLILGIVGLLLCQLVSPFAWVMGKRAIDEIDANPQMYGGRSTAVAGWILGIIGTVIIGLALVFLVIVVIIAVAGISTS